MITTNVKPIGNALAVQDERIQLPFPALRLNWHNGNPQVTPKEGAKYFGGWYSSNDKPDFIGDIDAIGAASWPSEITGPETWVNKDGKEYVAYSARAILAAPIASRIIWSTRDGKTTSRTDVLVYMATKTKNGPVAYAPAVLGAGGWAGNYILDAFKKFVTETTKTRNEFAPGVGFNFFYVAVGTWGDERVTKLVGKGAQSPIVPCVYAVPGEWNEESLTRYFVGDAVAEEMNNLRRQAEEWLAEKGDDNKSPQASNSLPELSTEPEDEFPF